MVFLANDGFDLQGFPANHGARQRKKPLGSGLVHGITSFNKHNNYMKRPFENNPPAEQVIGW
jgi:hypothetical protein